MFFILQLIVIIMNSIFSNERIFAFVISIIMLKRNFTKSASMYALGNS